ncbi:hypothetical protein [Aurantimonas coralicida]|uniref:hypothetical protein n=1 Tax=Aurantimonas coralicida TaxID=182270 RepID=UPI00165DE344|nr:hypothetical protein [Aurantimonas coralicida]MCC4296782.1 hypothetical protein [Aurantimonas coralicida]
MTVEIDEGIHQKLLLGGGAQPIVAASTRRIAPAFRRRRARSGSEKANTATDDHPPTSRRLPAEAAVRITRACDHQGGKKAATLREPAKLGSGRLATMPASAMTIAPIQTVS